MRAINFFVLVAVFLAATSYSQAQCQLLDQNGNPTANPIWIGCSQVTSVNDTTFNLTIRPPVGTTFNGFTINWGDGNSTAGAALTNLVGATHTFVTVGPGPTYADSFIVTLTSTTPNCTIQGVVRSGYPVTANIGVPGLTQLQCAPGALEFYNRSNSSLQFPILPSTVFTWDFGDGTPIQVFGAENAGDTLSHTYQRNTVSCVTEVRLTANNECNLAQSINTQSPVLIYDLDTARIGASETILCYPDTVVDFVNASLLNCINQGNTDQRYALWNFGDYWGLGYDSIVGWRRSRTPIQDPPSPLTIAYPGIGTYVVNMIDSNYCGQEPTSIVIQIVAPPLADFTISDDTICAGESVTFFNNTGAGANRFRWNFGKGGGFVARGAGNQTQTYNNPGTFTITLAVGINGANCNDTVSKQIFVEPTPVADIVLDNQKGCDSLKVFFTDNSTGTPPPNSWTWDFGNGNSSTVQNPPDTQQYIGANTYNVTLTVSNAQGCSNSDNEVVTVYQTPVPAFSPTSVCVGELSTFNDISTSAPGDPIVNWQWNFGDGSPLSMAQNPTHVYTSAGIFNVILDVATANCSDVDTIPLVVEQLPVADFTTSTDSGCSPLRVDFTNKSSANAVSSFWDFGDGDTITAINPTHVFMNTTSNDVKYAVKMISRTNFGCTDTIIDSIVVYPNPIASFNSDATLDCGPIEVNYFNFSSPNAVSFIWDFGDGDSSFVKNPTDTFENKTQFIQVYKVDLIAISSKGCQDTATRNITVYPEPQFTFGASPDSGCSPLQVNFPAVIGAVVYNWDFGDGTFGFVPNPTHTYVNNTNKDTVFDVQLIAQSPFGCLDTNTGQVKVYPNPTAQYNIGQNQGCSPLEIQFTNTSLDAVDYKWDFGDTTTLDTTALTISHIYGNNTPNQVKYNAKLIAESANGCLDSTIKEITVFAPVVAAFTGDTAGCSILEAEFKNESSPNSIGFDWDFGDGGTSNQKNPGHGYLNNTENPITYTITLIANSNKGCNDTVTSTIEVLPAPNTTFGVDANFKVYPDTQFIFTNNDLTDRWDYRWKFGDGDSLDIYGPSVIHNYAIRTNGRDYVAGKFLVSLTASNGYCESIDTMSVVIEPPDPVASFEPISGCEILEHTFINKSKYATDFLWDFDDRGRTSKERDGYHVFQNSGDYVVELTAFGEKKTVTVQQAVKVFETPVASFIVQPSRVFIPGNPVVGFNESIGDNLTYTWDFGDGTITNAEDPQHFYQEPGEYTISLIADNGQCADTLVTTSAVTALPGGSIRTANAFTPNPGGPSNGGRYDPTAKDNDIFFPLVENVTELEFTIYNKWGELLFFSDDPLVGWDGYYRGRLCKQDVYVWKIKAKLIDETEVIRVGDVTLIR